MILIERISNAIYSFSGSDAAGCKKVCRSLTFRNPDPWAYSQKIEKFDKRSLTFKLGMLPTVLEYLDAIEEPYELKDYEYDLPDGAVIDSRMTGRYQYQADAVRAFYKRRFGIITVPTRGGKTFIAAEIIRLFLQYNDGNVCFFVDNKVLFEQAISDFKKYFAPYGGIEIGEVRSNGRVDYSKRVTVAMIQTMTTCLENKVRRKSVLHYLKNLKMLIVDEIHDNSSDGRLKLYKKCQSLDYQLCLSATPYRKNAFVQNLKLKEWSGDIVYEITEERLRSCDVLADYKVFMLFMDHNIEDYEIDNMEFMDVRKKLIFENDARNKILVQVVDVLRELHLKTLLLFQSVEHGQYVSKLLGEPFISGETRMQDRVEERVKFLEREDGGILLASNIFKKGVTLPEVEVLINCDEGLEEANVIQRKGRVLGKTDEKSRSLVVDFFDLYDLYFSDHSETRLNTYVDAIGEDKVGLLDTTNPDWLNTFRRWTAKWFMKDVD